LLLFLSFLLDVAARGIVFMLQHSSLIKKKREEEKHG